MTPCTPPVPATPAVRDTPDTRETREARDTRPAAMLAKVRVWDAPVRVFHWLAVLAFAGAFITAESERWWLLHVSLGYVLAGLVVFRLVWGLVGSRHARFASFVRGPAAVRRYLLSVWRGQPEHHTGHNPAGALAMLALLALPLVIGVTGWALVNDIWGGWTEGLHETAANAMLALVGAHVVAALLSSWMHRENLVLAMFTGFKRGAPQEAITRTWGSVAVLLLAAVLAFGWLQWRDAPTGGLLPGVSTQNAGHGHDDDDDD